MKIFPFLLLLTAVLVKPFCSFAQQDSCCFPAPGTDEYAKLKLHGKLPQHFFSLQPDQKNNFSFQPRIVHPDHPAASVACSCMIPVDNSFSAVPFTSGNPPDYRNDDGSTVLINLPFSFCFYGQAINSCYINNNGNISFAAPYPVFSANSFPDPTFIMIAPFWGDVDTRDASSGIVHYKVTPTHMIVRWENVGYYDSHSDKLNDFQLIITDGVDPILPLGDNVSFCYGDMQWTTGDASGGVNGFGGNAATVGVNRGNGIDFIQIGQFNAPGNSYDGPFGNPDGVDWLDNQTFYFNVCNNGSGNNLPPIINSAATCDTLYMCIGDTMDISASFLSPEQSQITTINYSTAMTGVSVISNSSGNPAVINLHIVANAVNVGLNTITISGIDNGSPPDTTKANAYIKIVAAPTVSFTMTPPPPVDAGVPIQFTDNSPGATSWFWDFGDGNNSTQQDPTHTYAIDSLYTVTLTISFSTGCSATATKDYLVKTIYNVIAPNIVTPNGDGKNDQLQFVHLDLHPFATLEVYDRWGKMIYKKFDYQNDWTPNVADGVYYYVLTGPYLKQPVKGFFQVMTGK